MLLQADQQAPRCQFTVAFFSAVFCLGACSVQIPHFVFWWFVVDPGTIGTFQQPPTACASLNQYSLKWSGDLI
jgi:hypothetical protein